MVVNSDAVLNLKVRINEASNPHVTCCLGRRRVTSMKGKPVRLDAFAKELLSFSKKIPFADDDRIPAIRNRIVLLDARETLLFYYASTDQSFSCLQGSSFLRKPLESETTLRRLTGFTETQFRQCFPNQLLPEDTLFDEELSLRLYSVSHEKMKDVMKHHRHNTLMKVEEEEEKPTFIQRTMSWILNLFKKSQT